MSTRRTAIQAANEDAPTIRDVVLISVSHPTQAMIRAGLKAYNDGTAPTDERHVVQIYTAMIEAAMGRKIP